MTPFQLHDATRAALRARLPPRFTRADVGELWRLTEVEESAGVVEDAAGSPSDLDRFIARARVVNALLALANEEAAE